MTGARNPFDRFELDPASSLEGITEALRARAEEAASEPERLEARAAWEMLARHPETRLSLSLTAVPETRAAIGAPPASSALRAPRGPDEPLSLLDLLGGPTVSASLDRALGPPTEAEAALAATPRRTARARGPRA